MVIRRERGYIALLTVLIVSAIAIAISLVLLTTGINSQRSGLVEQQSKQARALAIACAQEALQQIHDNIGFTSTGNLSMGQGSCTYTVTSTGTTTRSILATGTVGNVVRKIQTYATIGSSSISITSWQEVS